MNRPLPKPDCHERDRQIASRRLTAPKLDRPKPANEMVEILFAAGAGSVARNLSNATL